MSHTDRGATTIAVKTADGTEEPYRLADRAARDTGKDIGEGAEKSWKVSVYYTEEGGQRVAHFFKKIIWLSAMKGAVVSCAKR